MYCHPPPSTDQRAALPFRRDCICDATFYLPHGLRNLAWCFVCRCVVKARPLQSSPARRREGWPYRHAKSHAAF
eukprot:4569613-Pyramimonas_sp.AAC.1